MQARQILCITQIFQAIGNQPKELFKAIDQKRGQEQKILHPAQLYFCQKHKRWLLANHGSPSNSHQSLKPVFAS